MIAVQCPHCGAPVRVSLAAPNRIGCSHCHYQGPPRPEDAQRLHGAARVVEALDQRRLQFSRFRRWSSTSGVGHVVAAVALAGPMLIAALISWIIAHAAFGEDVAEAAGQLNLAVTSLVLLMGIAVLLVKHRSLRRACAAVPPASAGEQATCFLCGAPLLSGAKGVARCSYCQTDNVVDPGLLARAGQREVASIENIEAEVKRRAKEAGSSLGWLAVVLTVVAVLAPIGLLAALVPLNERAKELPRRFAPWPREGASCLGRIHTDLWGNEFIGFSDHRFWSQLDRYEPKAGRKKLKPQQLVGRWVFGDGAEVAKVVAVEDRGPYSDVSLAIEGKLGRHNQDATATCLAYPPHTKIVAILDEHRPAEGIVVSRLEITDSHIIFGAGRALYLARRRGGEVRVLLPGDGLVHQVEAIGADLLVQEGQRILLLPRYVSQISGLAAAKWPGTQAAEPKQERSNPFKVLARCLDGARQFGVHDGTAVFADPSGAIVRSSNEGASQTLLQPGGAVSAVTVHQGHVLWIRGRAIFRAAVDKPDRPDQLAELGASITSPWIHGAGNHVYVRTKYRVVRIPIAGGEAEEWLPVLPEALFDFGPAGMLWAGGAPYLSASQPSLAEEVRLVAGMDARRIRLLGPGADDVQAVGLGRDAAAWLVEAEYRYGTKSGHPWLLVERPLSRPPSKTTK